MLRLTPFVVIIALATLPFVSQRAQTSNGLGQITSTSEQTLNLNPILSDDGSVVVFESSADLAKTGSARAFHTIRTNISSQVVEEIARSRCGSASLSSNGQKIAFASTEDLLGQNPDRNSEIYLFDGSQLRQLTHTIPNNEGSRLTDGNFGPSMSADGRLIAFSSNRDNRALDKHQIFLLDTSSNSIARLTESGNNTTPRISADGRYIYFIRNSSETDLVDLMLCDVNEQSISVAAANIQGLLLTSARAVSNDGARIVYAASTAVNQTQVFLYDSRANETRQITQLSSRSSDVSLNASISGDGKRVTFATRRRVTNPSDGSVELYLLDLPSGNIEQITTAPSNATGEVVSSLNQDGSKVAFSFPRVISEDISEPDFANNPEIYCVSVPSRPQFGQAAVANAATRNFEEHRIAPGSIATITGGQLSSRTEQSSLVDGKPPLQIRGTTVQVGGKSAELLYASPTEVIFVVPEGLADGPTEVVLVNPDGYPSKAQVQINHSAPGIFNPSGMAVILNADTFVADPFDPTDGQLRLTVFATGVRHAMQTSVTLGNETAQVEAIVPSSLPGLDEIHLRVPTQLRGAGTVSIQISADDVESNLASAAISGSSLRDIMINEILADPPDGLAGDSNHDGVRDAAADEFVELVNTTSRDIDMGGFQLQTRTLTATSDSLRHRFTAGTILQAGTAIVVFGGGSLDNSNTSFAGSQIIRASSGGLSLSNSGGVVTLREPSGALITQVTYGSSAGIPGDLNQSITRAPDIVGGFVLHQAAPDSQGHAFSPGTRIDGRAFLVNPLVAVVNIAPRLAEIVQGATLQFSAQAFDATGQGLADVIFRWHSSNDSVLTVDSNGLARAVNSGQAEITALGRGVQSTPSSITVLAPAPSPTPTPAPTVTPTPTPSPSPSSSPSPLPFVVISEFRTRGPNGASDEFVEIYNNSDAAVDVSGWKLKTSSNAGTVSNRLSIASQTVLPARKHLLLANSSGYSGTITPDQTFTSGFANDGGLALTLPNDVIVDQVGLSSGSAFREGMHLAPLPSDASQSYERLPGGVSGSTLDSGDNFNDFRLLTPSNPQNLASDPTPGPSPMPSPTPSPMPTPTIPPSPSPSPVSSPTPSPTPSPSASPSPTPLQIIPPLLISELRTRGPNGASDEFIEIYNNSDTAINVGGLKIRGSSNSGTITTRLTINSNVSIPARGHFLATNSSGYSGSVIGDQVFTSGIANDGGVALTLPDDTIIDQIGLSIGSAFKEGTPVPPLSSDATQSYERKPGGEAGSTQDTNDNFNDFQLLNPSAPQNTLSQPTPGPVPSPTPTPSPLPSPSPSPSASVSPSPTPNANPRIVISQVFGGGGNSGAPFRNDFVELFNADSTPVDLAGWSIQYSSATASTWSVTNLTSVVLAPGQYYLVQEAGGSNGVPLPSPDAIGTIALAATAGKLALVSTTTSLAGLCPNATNIVDLVGYGSSTSCFEGSGPTPAPGNSNGIIRANGGCTDSGNNANDFTASTPVPRNSSNATHLCATSASLSWDFVSKLLRIILVLRSPLSTMGFFIKSQFL